MTSSWLPRPMADLRRDLPAIVGSLEARSTYAAALLSTRQGLRITLDDREEQVSEEPPAAGSVVTAFNGATVHETAIGSFDPSVLRKRAHALAQTVKSAGVQEINPGPERHEDFVTPVQIAPETLTTEDKLARCRDLHRRTRRLDERIVNVRVTYHETRDLTVFCNRATDLAQRIQRVSLFLTVFVAGAGGIQRDWTTKGGTGGWELLTFTDEELHNVVESAVRLLEAERIEPGEYTLVTGPGVTGTICHESFGHGVETDMFLKKRARAAQFIGEVVGSPLVNIWDDPSYPGAYGSYFFDDEGLISAPTRIVDGGIFRRGITDLYSATALNIPRSANGRRQDFSRKAYARMSNTFFAPGTTSVAEIFAQVDHGIYLDRWSSGMEDPQGWGIQVTCHFGREIRNGRLTERIYAPVGISGYVPEVLQSIRAVGDDLVLDGGGCGKGHKEWVPVSSGGPHLLLKARLG